MSSRPTSSHRRGIGTTSYSPAFTGRARKDPTPAARRCLSAWLKKASTFFSRFNRFGCHIGRQQIVYYLNDKPYCAMPNLVGAGPWYMLMDVAVGGPAGEPGDPGAFPARMYIAGVKVIQF